MSNMRLRKLLRSNRALLAKESAARPAELIPVPADRWPPAKPGAPRPFQVFWNNQFLVQMFAEHSGLRMTVSRTTVNEAGNWDDNISWDDLQQLKREAGYKTWWAVELFPPDDQIINVANMRHLWLLAGEPSFGWRKTKATVSDERDGCEA